MTLVQGQPVEVHVNYGHVMGSRWCDGYVFHAYEAAGEHPLAATKLAPKEPQCLVQVVGGFSDGCVVRYAVAAVRAAVVAP